MRTQETPAKNQEQVVTILIALLCYPLQDCVCCKLQQLLLQKPGYQRRTTPWILTKKSWCCIQSFWRSAWYRRQWCSTFSSTMNWITTPKDHRFFSFPVAKSRHDEKSPSRRCRIITISMAPIPFWINGMDGNRNYRHQWNAPGAHVCTRIIPARLVGILNWIFNSRHL